MTDCGWIVRVLIDAAIGIVMFITGYTLGRGPR